MAAALGIWTLVAVSGLAGEGTDLRQKRGFSHPLELQSPTKRQLFKGPALGGFVLALPHWSLMEPTRCVDTTSLPSLFWEGTALLTDTDDEAPGWKEWVNSNQGSVPISKKQLLGQRLLQSASGC